jgi:hypothetical protein
MPPNHDSALEHRDFIINYIRAELSARHYTGPFSPSRLQNLIGHFRTSPLGVVPKAGSPDEFRPIQDFPFPWNDQSRASVNSEIGSHDFPCKWGTFSEIVLLVIDARNRSGHIGCGHRFSSRPHPSYSTAPFFFSTPSSCVPGCHLLRNTNTMTSLPP